MKKTVLSLAATCLFGSVAASPYNSMMGYGNYDNDIAPVNSVYLENVYTDNGWKSNWYVSVKGGVTAFLGKPVGHGDFFNRTKPLLNVSIGKWITPTVGMRLAYQGLDFKDSNTDSHSYQNIHADFMYNVSTLFKRDYETLPKWDIIPYIGAGLIRNNDAGQKPFALSYGMVARYRFTNRLYVSGELGNSMTWQAFDGYGHPAKMGDNLVQASIGITYTLGDVGWKRVIDPRPFMMQNELLLERLRKANEKINCLSASNVCYSNAVSEMKKILQIQGLLDKYEDLGCDGACDEVTVYPKNNYSGLNSLRARLREKNNGGKDKYEPFAWNPNDTTKLSADQYFQLMRDGKLFIGSPVFFFFKINTAKFNDKAQHINLHEIASVMKKYGLHAKIVGAADSKTGSKARNEKLSKKRAETIVKLLKAFKVPEDRMTIEYRGGIDQYYPLHGNRNACVMLYYK